MQLLKIPPPSDKQKRFFESRARFVGYGGARGGGKSWAMRTKLVLLCFRYPKLKCLLLRRTLPAYQTAWRDGELQGERTGV